ncbi:hypothetical protein AB0B44_32035, partial [Streptomyces sp. NPDC041003]
ALCASPSISGWANHGNPAAWAPCRARSAAPARRGRPGGIPSVRPVTGPRPDLGALGQRPGARVDVLFAEHARCHDAGRAARAAREALPGARVDVLPGVAHHALPLTAAGELARRLAA